MLYVQIVGFKKYVSLHGVTSIEIQESCLLIYALTIYRDQTIWMYDMNTWWPVEQTYYIEYYVQRIKNFVL